MWEPSQEFTQENAVPKDVIEYFSKYDTRLESRGVVAGEACSFLVLDPNVRILAHQRVAVSHPEAVAHYWAAHIKLPRGTHYKTLFAWNGAFLFLLVRASWNGFPPMFSELISRARQVEEGAASGPNLSNARLDFERFLEKHRELRGPENPTTSKGAFSPPETLEDHARRQMRLLREYRRLATQCMERLERLPM